MDAFEYDHYTSIRRPNTEVDATGFEVEADSRPVGRLYALGHVVFVQPKKIQVKGRGRTAATLPAKSRGVAPGAPCAAPALKQGARNSSDSEESQEDSEGSEGSGAEEAASVQPEEPWARSKSGRALAPPPWRNNLYSGRRPEEQEPRERPQGRGEGRKSSWAPLGKSTTTPWRSLQADAADEAAAFRRSKRDAASKREWPDPPKDARGDARGASCSPPYGEDDDGQGAFYPRPRGVGPKHKEWDTSIGAWVPKGQSRGKPDPSSSPNPNPEPAPYP